MLYNLVKCIGTKRPGTEDSFLPVTRMPMGLLEHCVNFFSSSNLQQVIIILLSERWLTTAVSVRKLSTTMGRRNRIQSCVMDLVKVGYIEFVRGYQPLSLSK